MYVVRSEKLRNYTYYYTAKVKDINMLLYYINLLIIIIELHMCLSDNSLWISKDNGKESSSCLSSVV